MEQCKDVSGRNEYFTVYVEDRPDKPVKVNDRRNADRIDGYDRDDLGESPDY
jgi:hypothetical protein